MPAWIESLVVAIAAFGVVFGTVVIIHELGHFWVARWLGVKIRAFSIGFGPVAVERTDKRGVKWRLSALPLGGYVMFATAQTPDNDTLYGPKGLYEEQSPLRRIAIASAGPLANILLSIGLLAILAMTAGEQRISPLPIVGYVAPESAADRAGLAEGDKILAIDGTPISAFDELRAIVAARPNEEVAFQVARAQGEESEFRIRIDVAEDPNAPGKVLGRLGVAPRSETYRVGPFTALFKGAQGAFLQFTATAEYLGRLLTGKAGIDGLAGPIGIAKISGDVARAGAQDSATLADGVIGVTVRLTELAAFLSIAVAFMNLLPLPMLDGGAILFYVAEMARGRPLNEQLRAGLERVSLVALLILAAIVTWGDIGRTFGS